jgi:hypothetical protein
MLKLSNKNESYLIIPRELIYSAIDVDSSVLAPLTLFVEGLSSLLTTARDFLIFNRVLVLRSTLLAKS